MPCKRKRRKTLDKSCLSLRARPRTSLLPSLTVTRRVDYQTTRTRSSAPICVRLRRYIDWFNRCAMSCYKILTLHCPVTVESMIVEMQLPLRGGHSRCLWTTFGFCFYSQNPVFMVRTHNFLQPNAGLCHITTTTPRFNIIPAISHSIF